MQTIDLNLYIDKIINQQSIMGNQGSFPFPSSQSSTNSYLEAFRSQLSENYIFSQASLPYVEDMKTGKKYVTYQYTTNFSRQAQILQQSLYTLKNFPNPNVSWIKQYFRSQQNSYCTQKEIFLIVYSNPDPYRLQKEYQLRKTTNQHFQTSEIIKIIETILSGLWFYERELPMSQSQHDILASRYFQLDMSSLAIDKTPQQLNLNRMYLIDPWLQDVINKKGHKSKYQAPQKIYVQREDKMFSYNQFHANLYILGLIGLQLYFMKPMQKNYQGSNLQTLKISVDRYLNDILKEGKNQQNIKLKEGLSVLLQSNPKKRQQIYYIWQFSTKDTRYLNKPNKVQKNIKDSNVPLFRNRSYSQPFSHQFKNQFQPSLQTYQSSHRYTAKQVNHLDTSLANIAPNQEKRYSQHYIRQKPKVKYHHVIQQKKAVSFIKQQPKVSQQLPINTTNKPYYTYKKNIQSSVFKKNIKNSLIKFNKLPDVGITTSIVPSNEKSAQRSYINGGASILSQNTGNFNVRFNSNQPISKTINRVNSVGHYSNLPTTNQLVNSFVIGEQRKTNAIAISNHINNYSNTYQQSFEATLNQLKRLQIDINLLSSKIRNQLKQSQIKGNNFIMTSQSRTYEPFIETKAQITKQTKQFPENKWYNFLKGQTQQFNKQIENNYKSQVTTDYNFSNLMKSYEKQTQIDFKRQYKTPQQKQIKLSEQKSAQSSSQKSDIKTVSYQEYHITNPIRATQQDKEISKPFTQIILDKEINKYSKQPQDKQSINDFKIQKPVNDFKIEKPIDDFKIQKPLENLKVNQKQQFKKFIQLQNQFLNLSSKRQQRTNVKPIENLLLQNKLKQKQKVNDQIQKQKIYLLEKLWSQNNPSNQKKDSNNNNSKHDDKNTFGNHLYEFFDKNQITDSVIVKPEMEEQKTQEIQSLKFMKDDQNKLIDIIEVQRKSQPQQLKDTFQQEQQNIEKRNSVIDGLEASPISEVNTDFDEKSKKFLDQSGKLDSNYFHKRRLSPNGIIFEAYEQNSSTSSRKRTPEKKQDANDSTESQYVCQQYQSGSRYEGFKKNGMRNGRGKFSYQDGGYYQGQWKDNKMHGWGKLFYENGKIAYEGYWSNDQFHGFGKVYNDSPVQLDVPFDYQNFDKLQDYWVYYQGSLVQDTKQGKGRIMLTNNERFEGDFHADRIQGYGKYWKMDGTVVQGIWKDSQLIKILSK